MADHRCKEMRIVVREKKNSDKSEVSVFDPAFNQEHRMGLNVKGTQDRDTQIRQMKEQIERSGARCEVVEIR